MCWIFVALWAAALVGLASGDPVSGASVYHDPETGFTFSQYNVMYSLSETITFRIAVPSPVTANQPYDAVLQVVAPIDVGWAGLAWGGQMTYNPLAVSWSNGNNVVVSSRFATQHAAPPTYSGATYSVFKTGTHVNRTHFQYTAKCTGCTTFTNSAGTPTTINPTGTNRLAFGYSSSRPNNPSSNTSSFPVHDVYNYWSQDFSSGANTAFASLAAKNLG
ncbi:CBD9-like protein [Mollisia scopiformis]|uniref:CBD9-like protein n=1 Tax=Mollisia scopiformis TaxID=149040 RepID=A0A132BCA1_MOLSC|nr:CBD9-like protein [Mollisia scopiformis]KUJ09998.1 CBD9-like protein [Mollisia scopiformis]